MRTHGRTRMLPFGRGAAVAAAVLTAAAPLRCTRPLRAPAQPRRPVEIPTESNRRPPPIYVNTRPQPKPEGFAHKVTYQKNPNPSIDAPMRVYQSVRPSLMRPIHMQTSVCEYMFENWRRAGEDKVACVQVETGESVTYGDMLKFAQHCSDVLYSVCRVHKGDTVLVCLPDATYFPSIAYGVINTGATLSTTNANISEEMLAHQIGVSSAKVVITTKTRFPVVQRAGNLVKQSAGYQVKILLAETMGRLTAEKMPHYHSGGLAAERDDVVLLPFSAGTTGDPKGAQLTNLSLGASIQQSIQAFGLTDRDVQLSVLPFFHIAGFTIGMSAILAAGGTLLIQAKFDVRSYVAAVQKHRVSFVTVTPPIVAAMVRHVRSARQHNRHLFSSLRLLRSTGAPLTPTLWSAIQTLCPHTDVGQIYGMTEMSPLVAATPLRAQGHPGGLSLTKAKQRQDTTVVGALVADTELRVVRVEDDQQTSTDASTGMDVEEGAEGELWVSGPQRMLSYVDPIVTKDVLVHGWYRTGDIGYIDKETGQLCITDRLRELIKYKGFYVSPVQVEVILNECPEVDSCVVFGVPDPHGATFELPRALVVLARDVVPVGIAAGERAKLLKGTEATLLRYVESRTPPHKRLHGGIRFVDEIPRTLSGKVMRRHIRKMELERLASEESGALASPDTIL